jgi:two-component system response regulator HydG
MRERMGVGGGTTTRNLGERIQEGRFRSDLYFRLKVVELQMPPLRNRPGDIPMLTDHFIRKTRHVRVVHGITPEARRALAAYPWPGNIRELQNTIERALVLGRSDFIQLADLSLDPSKTGFPEPANGVGFRKQVDKLRKTLIEDALERSAGKIPEAADILEISASYLRRIMDKLDIERT